MTVPKWLLPVISVIAAVAVGVALALVGANFASKQVADHPATTEKLPVLAPVATGPLSKGDAKLASAGKLPVSKVTGQATVVTPGTSLSSTGLEQAVRMVADGHASGDGPDTAATSTASTPSPSATPSPSGSASGTPGGTSSANDPCSPTSGNPPTGCPAGSLHGAIFADTIPPSVDFSMAAYDPACGTTATPDADAGYVDVPVTFHANIPAEYNVQWAFLTDDQTGYLGRGWQYQDGVLSDSHDTDLWNTASAANTPVPNLPGVHACFVVPHVPQSHVVIDLLVDGYNGPHATETIRHEYRFRVSGAGVLPEVEAETFASHDYFVAYTETIPGQAVDIRAYRITQNPSATCADVSGLPELSAQGERLIGTVNPQSTSLDIQLAYTQRVATGFVVAPGSVTLVCAKWYHGHEVPSFDRSHPYHSSSIIERAPDAFLPFLTVVGINAQGTGAMDVTASGSTIEGINCGSARVQLNSVPLVGPGHDLGRRICTESPSVMDSATNDPALRGEMVVTSDVERRGGQHILGQFVIPNPTTICIDCQTLPEDTFEVPLPDAPGTNNSMGTMTVVRGWDVAGTSGLRNWIAEPQLSVDSTDTTPANLPQLNTDAGLVIDGNAGAPGSALKFALSVDQDADFSVTLTGIPGTTTCTMADTDLTITGHYSIGSHPAALDFQHLCYDTIYLARVTLTGAHGTTVWGFQSGNNHWPRFLALTASGRIQMSTIWYLATDDGRVADGLEASVDGHGSYGPASFYPPACASSHADSQRTTLDPSGDTVTLHIRYQLRDGTADNDAGTCTISPGNDDPVVDVNLDLSISTILASADRYLVTEGPFRFYITMAAAP